MPDETAPSSFRLIYRSRDRIEAGRRGSELGGLFSTARANNKQQQVTGALLLTDRTFVQALEGEEGAVRALFERISADPRHDEVAVLDARTVRGRVFSRWAMAQVAEQGESDIALIAHVDGISPAAGRRPSGEQELVLDMMRHAARGATAAQ